MVFICLMAVKDSFFFCEARQFGCLLLFSPLSSLSESTSRTKILTKRYLSVSALRFLFLLLFLLCRKGILNEYFISYRRNKMSNNDEILWAKKAFSSPLTLELFFLLVSFSPLLSSLFAIAFCEALCFPPHQVLPPPKVNIVTVFAFPPLARVIDIYSFLAIVMNSFFPIQFHATKTHQTLIDSLLVSLWLWSSAIDSIGGLFLFESLLAVCCFFLFLFDVMMASKANTPGFLCKPSIRQWPPETIYRCRVKLLHGKWICLSGKIAHDPISIFSKWLLCVCLSTQAEAKSAIQY